MLTRRSLLGGLAAAPLLTALGTRAAAGAVPHTPATLPVTIANHTDKYANGAVRLYVVGVDLASGAQSHATADGVLHPVSLSDNGSDGFTDYSIPLAGDGDTTIQLPRMSGRIYVAIGDPLKFKAVADGNGNPGLAYPAGWVSGDPNYRVLHDFCEFTFNDTGMYCNTTAVDMFGIPLSLRLRGSADQTTGTLADGGRQAIFADLAAQPGYGGLVVDDLRVIAPGHGIETGAFAADYFDGYIGSVWSKYAGEDLTVKTDSGTYTGRVSGDTLAFDGGVAGFAKPSTLDVFYCAGKLAAPNDGKTGPVAAVLGAGFNRSTLLSTADQPTTDPGGFYAGDVTNHYARIMHAHTADGKAYGFPFDDVAGFASYIQDTGPTDLTLTLTPF